MEPLGHPGNRPAPERSRRLQKMLCRDRAAAARQPGSDGREQRRATVVRVDDIELPGLKPAAQSADRAQTQPPSSFDREVSDPGGARPLRKETCRRAGDFHRASLVPQSDAEIQNVLLRAGKSRGIGEKGNLHVRNHGPWRLCSRRMAS